ncbi:MULTISPECIES: type II toxin-antitoxin system VapC family toxin [Archaeoglobus]|uniref:Virulence associated protein C (VapC-2) n=3 Tax=Archaeoglobus fulgidus TaxID=2234 RepID=O28583_ARCFU|nr:MULTISPECIES: type II toxin-antitoxin system VapC family toxin [Archaeoglobus]AAB89560.1 virulence associated protein C (vapC-2) [Archaeoglobus fulgidus DSM 4304]AIG98690.1 putative nucleic acid-binding protein [Archaeoglobus fulgidus DSM 8774]KUJ92884.1 MAG: putative ribonuclease VapC [Archaeoglobus fulgidus]KUK06152.1 MAG: putative ribonuclease VapC [Archaeoglobus fulgidus]MDI3498701.1 hypothetical protein [Archaeoglobus sp.]
MILDTSVIIRIFRDRNFFEVLKERIDDDVKITSVTAYELQRGAVYIMLKHGRDYEFKLIRDFLEEVEILSFTPKDSEISAMIWAKLREKGYELNDADIMISAVSIRENEKLVTLDRDFEYISRVSELDVDILEEEL